MAASASTCGFGSKRKRVSAISDPTRMNRTTILALNDINRDFYRMHGAAFSASRRAAWPGFDRVADAFAVDAPQVLDVGCGNGRFADALAERLGRELRYLGLDADGALLEEARAAHAGPAFRLRRFDVVVDPQLDGVPEAAFSGIALIGFLHRVPGARTRRMLLDELARRLRPGGRLAVSVWRFAELERFRRRIVPWPGFLARGGVAIDPAELEPGDHLLPFGSDPSALRYCHALGEEEMRELLAGLPLEPHERFEADGRSGDLNRYWVLEAPR